MNPVFIIGGKRSFIGIKNKSYKNIPVEDLAAGILSFLIENNLGSINVSPDIIICGNSVGSGGNVARLASLKSSGKNVPAITMDSQCASGLTSVITAASYISSGLCDCVIAGGAESTSTQPIRKYSKNHPNFNITDDEKNYYSSAQFIPEMFGENVMIKGADEVARKYSITNEMMEEYIIDSHKKAYNTSENKTLEKYIHKIYGVKKDESIRKNMTHNFIKRFRPILDGGITTPVSSSLMHDGAAFIIMASEKFVKKNNIEPEFVFKYGTHTSGDGLKSPETILKAISDIVSKSNLKLSQIDRIDYNEAFAVIDVLYHSKYDIPSNCFGGALAYGHPYGATGCILMLHLMRALEINNERYGICTIPAAGGISSSAIIEKIK